MPACAIRWCSKSSKTSNLQKDGITFHLFPRNLIQRRKWTEVCNRPNNWSPTVSSSICSRHFDSSQFLPTPNNRRVLIKSAVPNLLLQKYELDIANKRYADSPSITIPRMISNAFEQNTSHEDIFESWQSQNENGTESEANNNSENENHEIKPLEYLQACVKEVFPELVDDNAVYVIVVNNDNENIKEGADLPSRTETNEPDTLNSESCLEIIKKVCTQKTSKVEQYLRKIVAQKTKLADERLKKIRALGQSRRRLLRRNEFLTKVIVQLQTRHIVSQLKTNPTIDSVNLAVDGVNGDSEKSSGIDEADEADEADEENEKENF